MRCLCLWMPVSVPLILRIIHGRWSSSEIDRYIHMCVCVLRCHPSSPNSLLQLTIGNPHFLEILLQLFYHLFSITSNTPRFRPRTWIKPNGTQASRAVKKSLYARSMREGNFWCHSSLSYVNPGPFCCLLPPFFKNKSKHREVEMRKMIVVHRNAPCSERCIKSVK